MKNYKEDLFIRLKRPRYAAHYLEAAIQENDPDFLQVALGDVIKAYGVSKISEQTGIARQAIYRMLSPDGNPTLKNLNRLLNAVGLEIDVRVKSAS